MAAAGGARLVCLDEWGDDLLPPGVVEAVGIVADGRAGDLVLEKVADVVALAGVVPGDELDQVRLQGQRLLESLRQIDLSDAEPVLARTKILELVAGDSWFAWNTVRRCAQMGKKGGSGISLRIM